ncbi:hypothetical protein BGX38DRAFT_1194275 [Terfezia claveryi]|nr:hypothetical protein BGX38DRAFT_1194275 [Terfezia claveryi]
MGPVLHLQNNQQHPQRALKPIPNRLCAALFPPPPPWVVLCSAVALHAQPKISSPAGLHALCLPRW